jgi:hypothetical protein
MPSDESGGVKVVQPGFVLPDYLLPPAGLARHAEKPLLEEPGGSNSLPRRVASKEAESRGVR